MISNTIFLSEKLTGETITSTLNLQISRDFDGEEISCEIRQLNESIQTASSGRLRVNYSPKFADVSVGGQFAGDALGANCSTNGRPAPKITIFLGNQPVAASYVLTPADDGLDISCQAENSVGEIKSARLRLIVRPRPTPSPITQDATQNSLLTTLSNNISNLSSTLDR